MNVSLIIDDIITIDENDGFFKTKITMERRWLNTQLTYQNLKRDVADNRISKEDREKMWTPWTVFENIEHEGDLRYTDLQQDILRIIPHPEFRFEKSDRTNVRNTRLFKGSENVISYRRQYTVKWMCSYNMRWYPFDTQRCTIEMFSPESSVTLNPVFVNYSGPVDLPQHFVKGVHICAAIINDKSGFIVEVFLGRPIFGTFLSVFMPTIILLLLSQIMRVFGKEYFELVIEVNLTILLVLATL